MEREALRPAVEDREGKGLLGVDVALLRYPLAVPQRLIKAEPLGEPLEEGERVARMLPLDECEGGGVALTVPVGEGLREGTAEREGLGVGAAERDCEGDTEGEGVGGLGEGGPVGEVRCEGLG